MKAILLIAVFVSIASASSSDLTAQNASTAEPAITPTATAVTPATPARSLASPAPSAVYFLTQWVSVKTQDSIRGYPPGTRLTVVGNLGDHLKVKAGDVEFEVKTDQVTNDPQIATQALQREVRQRQAQQREIPQTDQIKGQHDKLPDLEARYSALQQEEDDLLLQIGTAEQINYQNGPLVAQLSLLRSHLSDVQNEKNKVRTQLEQAQRSLQKQP
jgi:hypothetical protein